jgi:hypothetical protein
VFEISRVSEERIDFVGLIGSAEARGSLDRLTGDMEVSWGNEMRTYRCELRKRLF